MPACKHCKYWLAETGDIVGTCDAESDAETPPVDGFIVHVEVLDDSGLWYELRTGPYFSCSKFERKQT